MENQLERLRVQMEFSPKRYAELKALREEVGASSNQEVLRNALRVYEWLVEQSRAGRILEVRDPAGESVGKMEAKWLLR